MSEIQDIPAIREFATHDCLESITQLVHTAYAPQAARGLRYWGTHQTVEETAKRFASGHGLIAELNGEYVGTIIVRPPQPESPVALYREPNTWSISQFAVAPSFKGHGLGRAMHDAALTYALKHQGIAMALDTAEPALALISMYQAWGYQIVGKHDWRPHTNYVSVVMCRQLLGA